MWARRCGQGGTCARHTGPLLWGACGVRRATPDRAPVATSMGSERTQNVTTHGLTNRHPVWLKDRLHGVAGCRPGVSVAVQCMQTVTCSVCGPPPWHRTKLQLCTVQTQHHGRIVCQSLACVRCREVVFQEVPVGSHTQTRRQLCSCTPDNLRCGVNGKQSTLPKEPQVCSWW